VFAFSKKLRSVHDFFVFTSGHPNDLLPGEYSADERGVSSRVWSVLQSASLCPVRWTAWPVRGERSPESDAIVNDETMQVSTLFWRLVPPGRVVLVAAKAISQQL
jgi:hypothetical protein